MAARQILNIEEYNKLRSKCRTLNWRDRARLCIPDCELSLPTSDLEILAAEKQLQRSLPGELRSLLLESDGIFADLGVPVVEKLSFIVSDNLDLWSYRDRYMAPSSMFAFGGSGNGDRFFFPILPDGSYRTDVFLWNHEGDDRTWLASSLEDYFCRIAAVPK